MAEEKEIETNPKKHEEKVGELTLVKKRIKDLEVKMAEIENGVRERGFVDRYTRQRVETLERSAIKMRKQQDKHEEKWKVLDLRTNDLVDTAAYEYEKYEKMNERFSTMECRAKCVDEILGSDHDKQQIILQRVKSLEDGRASPDNCTLIVTSSEITDSYGNVILSSLVEPRAKKEEETHTDTARRLVTEKTGIDIPTEDIISCNSMEATDTTFRIVFGNTRRAQ